MIQTRTLNRIGRNGKRVTVYDVRLRDPAGKEYSQTFRTKKEAEAFEDAERTQKRRGSWIDPRLAALTVAELAAQWLESNPAKRSGSRARDDSIIRLHIAPTLADRAIGSVTQPDVQALVNTWSQKAKPRTVERQYGTLQAIFNYAVDADYLPRTPCRRIKLPEPAPLRRNLPDQEQLEALADALPNGLMVWVAVVTGLRWAEVAGLRVGSVDVIRNELKVVEQRTRDLFDDDVTAEPKSRAGVRTMGIPAELAAMFAAHLVERGLTGADTDKLIFVAERGGPLNYSHWRERVWNPGCVRVGLGHFVDREALTPPAGLPAGDDRRCKGCGKSLAGLAPQARWCSDKCRHRYSERAYVGLTFHDLRRYNATGLVAEGIDLKTAQTRFGHSDIRLTIELYAQAVTEADRAAADALGARFLPRGVRGTH